jgi:hypothetical protein
MIFDVSNRLIGIARARCSDDPTMILGMQDYGDYGNVFGLDIADKY